jgi:hypothetical protein
MSEVDTSIPAPEFLSGDETSMKLSWKNFSPTESNHKVFLQFKIPQVNWEKALEIPVLLDDSSNIVSIDKNSLAGEIVDLEPGTPYCVRFVKISENGIRTYGKETVFDTKPIGCGPKKKSSSSCIIV